MPNALWLAGRRVVLAVMVVATLVSLAVGQADVQGQWSTASYQLPINPIHEALLHNGKILIVTGSGNCLPSVAGCPQGPPYGPANGSGAILVDPTTGTITAFTVSWDMFCNGMLVLPDGRAFIDGGTITYTPSFEGIQKSAIFDPSTNTFTDVPQNMAHGRWYPTVLTLGDGRIMAFSGLDENDNTNPAVEFYTVGSGWSTQYIANWTPPLYPRLTLLPSGKVFFSGMDITTRLFDPSNQSWTTVGNRAWNGTRLYGSSVLLPLTPENDYDPVIMAIGGGYNPTNTTEMIDMGASSPAWQLGPDMSQLRIEQNAVLLPTQKVLVLGGSSTDEDGTTASLNADLYDPASNSFSSAGANTYPRLYHSNGLLLPDATVWVSGSNPNYNQYEPHVEIYQPAYLFTRDGNNNVIAATRPTITSVPSAVAWGAAFTVSTPDAANISSAVFMHPGAPTHAFDTDQRVVGLSFTRGSGTLTVTAPPNGNIAPPGYYMLFLVNSSGVPSVAKFIQLGTTSSAPAPTVSSITPTSGTVSGGTRVTITGTGFQSGATVSIGGTAATAVTVGSSTSITATTGAHAAGLVSVVVSNSDAQSGTLSNGFTYTGGNPAPTVSSIAPNTGTSGGGTRVTISGTGFEAGATVSLGGTAATGVTVVSSTSITATTAAHAAGTVSVVVTNSDGQNGTLANGYTYTAVNPAPTVSSIAPNTGTSGGGTRVTVSGTGFAAGATVSLGGTAATGVTVVSSTSITATTAAHAAGAVSVVVTNTDGQTGTLANGYTYASSGGGGGGPITFVQVNVATPQTPTQSVPVAFGVAQTAGDLNVIAAGWNDTTSAVTSVTDTRGNSYLQAGVVTTGTGLRQAIYYARNIAAGNNTVTVAFNAAVPFPDIRILEYSGLDTTSPFDASAGAAGAGNTASSGAAVTASATELIFGAGMTATEFSSAGTGFTLRVLTAQDGDIAEDELATTAGSYSATAPNNNAGSWVMQMATFRASGQGTTNPAPTISSISPTSGTTAGGTSVSVTGSNFRAGATLSLGGTAATGVKVVSGTSITAITAAHSAGAVNVVVTNQDAQSATLTNGFTYSSSHPVPTVSAITPNTGTAGGGTAVSVTGTGFLSGATLTLGGTTATGVTVVNSTTITATTPAHAAGVVSVVVTNSDGQTGTLANAYTYSSSTSNFPSLALGVPSGSSSSATVNAGQPASYSLSIGGAGIGGSASITCTGAPTGATCAVPANQPFSATSSSVFAVNVTTTSRTVAALSHPSVFGRPVFVRSAFASATWLWTFPLLGIVALPGMSLRKRSLRRYLCLAPLALLLVVLASCGGGSVGGGTGSNPNGPQANPNGTPAGTYQLNVTATSGAMSQTTALTLVVR